MRYRVYFSESETKQIEEAAIGSRMSPTRFIRYLVSTHLADDRSSSPDTETTVRQPHKPTTELAKTISLAAFV